MPTDRDIIDLEPIEIAGQPPPAARTDTTTTSTQRDETTPPAATTTTQGDDKTGGGTATHEEETRPTTTTAETATTTALGALGQTSGAASLPTVTDLKKRRKQKDFLAAWVDNLGNVRYAARACPGTAERTHYYWLMHDPHYQEMYRRAYEVLAGRIEAGLIEAATIGDVRELTFKGMRTGDTIREIDRLGRLAVVKKFVPEYRESSGNLIGISSGGDVTVTFREPERQQRSRLTQDRGAE